VKARLRTDLNKLRRIDGNNQMLITGAILATGLGLLIGNDLSKSRRQPELFTNIAVTGAVLGLSAVFIIDENLSKKKVIRQRIVDLYNQDL
jgi:hypothetical protein